jgi:hypothetical protein
MHSYLEGSTPVFNEKLVPVFNDRSTMNEKHIERVRRICASLPEVSEKLSHGEPTFFVRKKVFAMCSNNHHNDGHIAVTIPTAIGIQQMLIETEPKKFYRPPYVGVRGWVGIELPRVTDRELAFHLREAWKLIAPEKIHSLLDQSAEKPEGKRGKGEKGTRV